MSRIGKQPIVVPSGVKVDFKDALLNVNGPKGNLSFKVVREIELKIDPDTISVVRKDDTKKTRALHGLVRALVANMVNGVTVGFEKKLELVGIGYKADLQGNVLVLNLGYSHPVKYELRKGITAEVDKQTLITIKGIDKQAVGQTAAEIRSTRPPEPYKGKGVKYVDEQIRRKVGKTGAK
jgi:large subunit ribosomal protein L6